MPLIPGEFKPELHMSHNFKPRIVVSKVALDKMSRYVDLCKFEIGWMGTATKLPVEEPVYQIDDVFLFKQTVGGANTNAEEGALIDLAAKLTPEQLENLRFWGHSHVEMSTFFSNVDFDNMRTTFYDGGRTDWYIGNVCNKKGQMKFYMFFPDMGLYVSDVPWKMYDENEDRLDDAMIAEISSMCTHRASTYAQTHAPFPEKGGNKPRYQGHKSTQALYEKTEGASFTSNDGAIVHVDAQGQPLKLLGEYSWVEGIEKDKKGRPRHFIYTKRGKWISATGQGWVLLQNAQELAKEDAVYAEWYQEDKKNTSEVDKAVEDYFSDNGNLGSQFDRFLEL